MSIEKSKVIYSKINQMSQIKLLKNFEISDLSFKPVRKTETGSRIIDVISQTLYQTGWLKIIKDVEYSLIVNAEKIKDILIQIDEKIIDYSAKVLEFSKEEIFSMYKPLLKENSFRLSILTKTILFDRNKKYYNKEKIKDILKYGQNVRFIFEIKKIYFKDHELILILELNQIELA